MRQKKNNNLEKKRLKLTIVSKYILQEYLTTFLLSFFFFFVIFFINYILLYIKELLLKSIPADLITAMTLTFFPSIIVSSLPFGVMLATLMTMGRFSSDNEIIAFRALGFNLMKIFMPIFISGLFITAATFLVNDRLVPLAWQQQRSIMRKIAQIKPTLDFKSKTVKKHEDKSIYTNIVQDTSILGLFIIERDQDGKKRVITAKKADIITSKEKKGVIELKMHDAMIQFENKDRPSEFNFGYSSDISYFIEFQNFDDDDPKSIPGIYKSTYENYKDVVKYKKVYKKDKRDKKRAYITSREDLRCIQFDNEQYIKENITATKYANNIKKIDTETPRIAGLKIEKIRNSNLNYSSIYFFRKFSYPLACIIFAIFAAPIGIYSRRAGYQIGFIIGLFLSAIYWFSFSGTHILGFKFLLTPFMAMSLPNVIFLIIGVIFLIKRLRE